jgi:hypothetical protein
MKKGTRWKGHSSYIADMENQMNNEVVVKKIRKGKKAIVVEEVVEEIEEVVEEVEEEVVEEEVSEMSGEKSVQEEDDVEGAIELLNQKIAEFKAKKEALEFKKRLLTKAGELTTEFINVRSADILSNEEVIRKLTEENEEFKRQIQEITEIAKLEEDMTTDYADDIMTWFSTNQQEFGNSFLFPEEEDTSKQKSDSSKSDSSKKKGTRTAIDRLACRDLLVDRMVFKASANHKTDKSLGKIDMEIVFNAETKKFYNRVNNKEYALLQDANRDWCEKRGYDKLGNAWEDFKALNLKKNVVRSIHNIHNDNWIENEGANDYVDAKFKFFR